MATIINYFLKNFKYSLKKKKIWYFKKNNNNYIDFLNIKKYFIVSNLKNLFIICKFFGEKYTTFIILLFIIQFFIFHYTLIRYNQYLFMIYY